MAFWFWLCLSLAITASKTQAQNTTDPAEARVINAMFKQWGINESAVTQQGWNISGELCSGAAVNSTFFYYDYNPGINCDCNFPNSTCHITGLSVYEMDAVGTIPEGLWTLTYLTYLDLSYNYLTGPLSSYVGNLTRMQTLYIDFNALSGQVPSELGQLTDLRLLSFGKNNFEGSLPSELGNLRRLELLSINSAEVGGDIPSTFSNLQNLQYLLADDNGFTGSIPDYIGNWSQLEYLSLEGNSFEGPIPPSFSRLTSLRSLWISGLSNGTLDFIRDLKSMHVISLRNNRLSGSIPNDIAEFTNLTRLDLSFNNLNGPIPTGLWNLSQMAFLSLGNNSLTGTLPTGNLPNAMNPNLSYIDLSYNALSGTLPSWAIHPTLQLNILVNNFTLNDTGLNCLQRGFPYGRGSPRYSNFSINCGGPQITSSTQVVHEQDNEPLGNVSYYLTPERRWAVSKTYRLLNNTDMESTKRQFNTTLASTLRQFTNTQDSGLFQTARLSSGSLRYYGLALENGNYNIKLQFAEIEIEDGHTWRSRQRRIFDIYIQGTMVVQDFDIKRAAGGASFSPVTRDVTAEVLNNYLEVHLFWAGKGTLGPLISAISVTPNFNPTVSNNPISNNSNNPPSNNKKNNTSLVVGILVPLGAVIFFTLLALYILRQRRKTRRNTSGNYDEEFLGIEARPYTFSYEDLRDATDDFSPTNKLGQGGFGSVYKGTLADGRVIAVKQLSIASHQGKSQFVAEIATISAVQHRNLVKLYGCCIDGEKRLLVYEYLENNSLDQALFGSKRLSLTWSTRFDICMGIARGLAYLHEESRIRVIHRDVKSSNVLLDSNMNPKISDFGLAKLYDDNKTHLSTRVAGTFGYLAPEYALWGHLTEKVDVFGFGVVALEIISGRPNSDSSLEDDKTYILGWAWKLYEANRELELVDKDLSEFDETIVKRVMRVSLLCTQFSSTQRPSISRVVAMLSGDMEVSGVITRPEYLTCFEFDYSTTFKSASQTSIVSPHDSSQPMLHNIMGQGM